MRGESGEIMGTEAVITAPALPGGFVCSPLSIRDGRLWSGSVAQPCPGVLLDKQKCRELCFLAWRGAVPRSEPGRSGGWVGTVLQHHTVPSSSWTSVSNMAALCCCPSLSSRPPTVLTLLLFCLLHNPFDRFSFGCFLCPV